MLRWIRANKEPVIFGAVVLGLALWIYLFLNFPEIKTLAPEKVKQAMPSTADDVIDRMAKIPFQLIQLHDTWLNEAVFWRRVHYVLAIASVVLSALVASGSSILTDKTRNIVAVCAAVATGLLTSLTPYKQYEEFISAWRIVNVAKLQYLSGKYDLNYLVGQVGIAENLLKESRHYQEPEPQQPPVTPAPAVTPTH
jgi:hypothetical protein